MQPQQARSTNSPYIDHCCCIITTILIPDQPINISRIQKKPVRILSVQDDLLLAGSEDEGCSELYIYNLNDNSHRVTIESPDEIYDAMLTPHGNIIYTTMIKTPKVVLVSGNGQIVSSTEMSSPFCLYLSTDNIAYLAEYNKGIYQSTDGGLSWSHVFTSGDDYHCLQVIKVSHTHNQEELWTLEENDHNSYRLRKYAMNGTNGTTLLGEMPRDVLQINMSAGSRLAYDGSTRVFLTDFWKGAIHLFSHSGQYQRKLISLNGLIIYQLVVDTSNKKLYVGQENGQVNVFLLSDQ